MKASYVSLFLIAVLLSGFSLGFAPVRADELPKDTNKITSLTPEQARKLAAEFQGMVFVAKVGPGPRGEGHQLPDALPLNGLTTLDVETAKALTKYGKGALLLGGLSHLGSDAAQALATFEGDVLFFGGLTEIDARVAAMLADFKGERLYLNGLTSLDASTAKALAGFKGMLGLNGLTTLDADTAKILGGRRCDVPREVLHECFLRNPSDRDVGRAYVELCGGELYLVTTLDADFAKTLAAFEGEDLWLDKVTTLDAAAARALARFKGRSISLEGLSTLDAEAFQALAESEAEHVSMSKVISAIGAEVPLTEEIARVSLTLEDAYELPGVTAFTSPDSVAIAEILATREGGLSLPNLGKISPKTLSALIEKENVQIPPIETLELIPEPDGSVTEDFVIPAGFQERQKRATPGGGGF